MGIYVAHTDGKNTGKTHIIQKFCRNQGFRGCNLGPDTSRFISAHICFPVLNSFSLPAGRLLAHGKYMLTFSEHLCSKDQKYSREKSHGLITISLPEATGSAYYDGLGLGHFPPPWLWWTAPFKSPRVGEVFPKGKGGEGAITGRGEQTQLSGCGPTWHSICSYVRFVFYAPHTSHPNCSI